MSNVSQARGGIDSGGGFITDLDLPANEQMVVSTIEKLPNIVLKTFNSFHMAYRLGSHLTPEDAEAYLEQIKQSTPETDIEKIRESFYDSMEINKRIFLNPDFPNLVKNATVAAEKGPCFAKDGSERDGSVVHPTHDICLSVPRILAKVNYRNLIQKTLPLIYKEYGRLAGLDDKLALKLQERVSLFGITDSSWDYFSTMHWATYKDFFEFWEYSLDEIKNATSIGQACARIGSLENRLSEKFLYIWQNFSLVSYSQNIALTQTEIKISLLQRYCIQGADLPNRKISLLEYYHHTTGGNGEMDDYDKELFSANEFILPLPYDDKEALLTNLETISNKLDSFKLFLKPDDL